MCHFVASMISGLVTTAASMPVDIAKTRVQNMRMIDGKPEYRGALVSGGKMGQSLGSLVLGLCHISSWMHESRFLLKLQCLRNAATCAILSECGCQVHHLQSMSTGVNESIC